MSSLETQFNNAAEQVKNLSKKPTNDELLNLYGLYKQATVGDNYTAKPAFLDMKGKAKWDSWDARKNMSKTDAMNTYISFVNELQKKY